jgi:hypothetical protein
MISRALEVVKDLISYITSIEIKESEGNSSRGGMG